MNPEDNVAMSIAAAIAIMSSLWIWLSYGLWNRDDEARWAWSDKGLNPVSDDNKQSVWSRLKYRFGRKASEVACDERSTVNMSNKVREGRRLVNELQTPSYTQVAANINASNFGETHYADYYAQRNVATQAASQAAPQQSRNNMVISGASPEGQQLRSWLDAISAIPISAENVQVVASLPPILPDPKPEPKGRFLDL